MMIRYILTGMMVIVAAVGAAKAVPTVQKVSDTVVHSAALTFPFGSVYGDAINGLSFQQEAVMSHNGWQYVVYYSGDRRLCLSRRCLPDGPWQTIVFTDYYFSGTDAHDVAVMGLCPNDGTIHLAFDHHGDTLHYRVSQAGAACEPGQMTWSAALFGPVRTWLEQEGKTVTQVTYPRFFQTPEGDMKLAYRYGSSGDGDSMLVDYDGATGTWSGSRMVIHRQGVFTDSLGTSYNRCAYPNGWHCGPDGTIHVTWVWRENATVGANHGLQYSASRDDGWTWVNGSHSGIRAVLGGGAPQTLFQLIRTVHEDNVIARLSGNPSSDMLIRLDSPGVTAVAIDRYYGLMNQQAQAIDPEGRIHAVMWHCSEQTYAAARELGYTDMGRWGPAIARRYHHYWRDHDGHWQHVELPFAAGSRPTLFFRENGDAVLIYQSCPDPQALGYDIYFDNGDLTVCAATAVSGWTDWAIVYVEQGPFINEMLGDAQRFAAEGVLSVMVQETPAVSGGATPLRIVDYVFAD
jgi:hypothetical protein